MATMKYLAEELEQSLNIFKLQENEMVIVDMFVEMKAKSLFNEMLHKHGAEPLKVMLMDATRAIEEEDKSSTVS